MKEKIEELRIWAAKRARNASKFKNVVIVKQFQAEDRNNDLN
jgi:hypothetical protein